MPGSGNGFGGDQADIARAAARLLLHAVRPVKTGRLTVNSAQVTRPTLRAPRRKISSASGARRNARGKH